jgi:uncharacterized protein YgiM (DUF1202 family)
MELGKVIRKKGKVWVEIALPGGQKGYISGETKIFSVRKATLISKTADMLESAEKSAAVIKTLLKGAQVTVTAVEKKEDGTWFKSTDDTGTTGYISSAAKLRVVPEYTRPAAIKSILTGLLFIIIGVVLTIMNAKVQQGNGMIYISYAVVFFGLLQAGQGAVEYYKAGKSTDTNSK